MGFEEEKSKWSFERGGRERETKCEEEEAEGTDW